MTVGELKDRIKDLPDNAQVFYERIEDVYFTAHHWETKPMPSDFGVDNPCEYIAAFGAVKYKDDPNLYITAHY